MMDPDVSLEAIRDRVRKLTQQLEHDAEHGHDDPMASHRPLVDVDDVRDLVELVGGLDAWLSQGGFPPAAWSKLSTWRGET